jgi:hypothetical protein
MYLSLIHTQFVLLQLRRRRPTAAPSLLIQPCTHDVYAAGLAGALSFGLVARFVEKEKLHRTTAPHLDALDVPVGTLILWGSPCRLVRGIGNATDARLFFASGAASSPSDPARPCRISSARPHDRRVPSRLSRGLHACAVLPAFLVLRARRGQRHHFVQERHGGRFVVSPFLVSPLFVRIRILPRSVRLQSVARTG